MPSNHSHPRVLLIAAAVTVALSLGCDPTEAELGSGGTKDAGPSAGNGNGGGGADAGGGGAKTCDPTWIEVCDGVDNNCDGKVDELSDQDKDGILTCSVPPDCNDTDPTIFPGAVETANMKDDDCDGTVDNKIPGGDFDGDGSPYPQDCDDQNPLIGQNAVEVAGDNTDNDCDGIKDNVLDCDTLIKAACTADPTACIGTDMAASMGICGKSVLSAAFTSGNIGARKIRAKLGDTFTPRAGTNMVHLSTGQAKDKIEEPGFSPTHDWNFQVTHPFWTPPRLNCARTCTSGSGCNSGVCSGGVCKATKANDLETFKIQLKVPSNAKSFSYQVNFFSVEYPEYTCTEYNDRFIALLQSEALNATDLPGGAAQNCLPGKTPLECNITFDTSSPAQPLTVNNGFLDICDSSPNNMCTKPSSLLNGTGYEGGAGGATGWLTTKAPVKPGEIINLTFHLLDEGDGVLDSAVLLDNFKWELEAVQGGPTTGPIE